MIKRLVAILLVVVFATGCMYGEKLSINYYTRFNTRFTKSEQSELNSKLKNCDFSVKEPMFKMNQEGYINPPNGWYKNILNKEIENEAKIDLIPTIISNADCYGRELAEEGLIVSLDDYLKTEKGRLLYKMYPKEYWDEYTFEGKIYAVPAKTNIAVNDRSSYYINIDLAKKYNISLDGWDKDIYKMEERLKKINEIIKKDGIPICDYITPFYNMPEYPRLIGNSYDVIPIAYDKTSDKFVFMYDNEKYIKTVGLMVWVKEQIDSLSYDNNTEPFIIFGRTHEKSLNPEKWMSVGKGTFVVRNFTQNGVSVFKTCKEKEKALDNLYDLIQNDSIRKSEIYDKLRLGRPVKEADFLTHLDSLKCKDTFGFRFNPLKVKKIWADISNRQYEYFTGELDEYDLKARSKEMHELGIDELVKEVNRQYSEWKNKK